jgi:hypothetical protein
MLVTPDRRHVSFKWSYPNFVPLPAAEVAWLGWSLRCYLLGVLGLRRYRSGCESCPRALHLPSYPISEGLAGLSRRSRGVGRKARGSSATSPSTRVSIPRFSRRHIASASASTCFANLKRRAHAQLPAIARSASTAIRPGQASFIVGLVYPTTFRAPDAIGGTWPAGPPQRCY